MTSKHFLRAAVLALLAGSATLANADAVYDITASVSLRNPTVAGFGPAIGTLTAAVDANASGQVASWSFSTTGVSLSGSGTGASVADGVDSQGRYVVFGDNTTGNGVFVINFNNPTGFAGTTAAASLGIYNAYGWNAAFPVPSSSPVYDLAGVTVTAAVAPTGGSSSSSGGSSSSSGGSSSSSGGSSSSSGGSGHAVPAPALAGLLGLGLLGLASRRKRA